MPALAIPAADEVDRIVIAEKSLEPSPNRYEIEDRAQIARIVRYLSQHNQGWHQPFDTFPISDYSVVLKHGNEAALVIWFGYDWIGGNDGGENRLRHISREEAQEFLEMVGIPPHHDEH